MTLPFHEIPDEPEAVDLHTQFRGGGFGRRAAAWSDYVAEAAHVAKGEPWPVKTTWTREDDTRGGQYRPMTLHRSRLALGADGRPLAWHNRVVGQSIDGFRMFGMEPENFDAAMIEGLKTQPYTVPLVNLEAHMTASPVTTLWWRSVGHTHTAFMKETLFDEAAHAAGADPMDYRLGLLEAHPRFVALLKKVRQMSGWGREFSGRTRQWRRCSCAGKTTLATGPIRTRAVSAVVRVPSRDVQKPGPVSAVKKKRTNAYGRTTGR